MMESFNRPVTKKIRNTFIRQLEVGGQLGAEPDFLTPSGLGAYDARRFDNEDFEDWISTVFEDVEKSDLGDFDLAVVSAYILCYRLHGIIPGEYISTVHYGYLYLPFLYLPTFLHSGKAVLYTKHIAALLLQSPLHIQSDVLFSEVVSKCVDITKHLI